MSAQEHGVCYRILSCIVAGFFSAVVGSCAPIDDQTNILTDLESIAQSGKPSGYLTKLDAVCFNFNNARAREEIAEAADRARLNIKPSLDACGVGRSCCAISSDVSGIIATVEKEEIKCVEIDRFVFLLETQQAMCVKPSELKVSRKKFASRVNPPGRQWFSKPGEPYFEIGEFRR
jgi:hypothetical protein